MADVTLAALIAAFLAWCGQRRSANTTRQYATRLHSLGSTLGDRPSSELTALDLDGWLIAAGSWPDGQPKSPDTQRANAIAVQQLQRFALDRQVISAPWLAKIEKPTGNLRERLPTEQETAAILRAASPAFRRIVEALRHTGARPGELASALIADWDRARGVILIQHHKTRRKSGKPRRIAVGAAVRKLLDESTRGRDTGPLFLSPRGVAWTSASLTKTFARLRQRLGLPRDLILYLTRHEHATVLCRKRGIHAAAQALGHASIRTTQRYVRTSDEDLRANQEAFDDPPADPAASQ